MKDDSDSEKQQQIHHIKNLYAFYLFCQKRFDESMQVFAKLGTGNTWVWPWLEFMEGGEPGKGRRDSTRHLRSGKASAHLLIIVPHKILWVATVLCIYSLHLVHLVSSIKRLPVSLSLFTVERPDLFPVVRIFITWHPGHSYVHISRCRHFRYEVVLQKPSIL